MLILVCSFDGVYVLGVSDLAVFVFACACSVSHFWQDIGILRGAWWPGAPAGVAGCQRHRSIKAQQTWLLRIGAEIVAVWNIPMIVYFFYLIGKCITCVFVQDLSLIHWLVFHFQASVLKTATRAHWVSQVWEFPVFKLSFADLFVKKLLNIWDLHCSDKMNSLFSLMRELKLFLHSFCHIFLGPKIANYWGEKHWWRTLNIT